MPVTVRTILCLCAAVLSSAHSTLADWPQFRGTNSSGVAEGPAPPVEFGPGKKQLWRVPLASGHSSPCVTAGALFVTTYEQESRELAVVCIDCSDGTTRWTRTVRATGIEKGHPSFNPASSSPACDGERVVAYFGSFGLICFDMSGDELWRLPMPLTKSFAGNATSPVIVGDKVILYRGNYVDHFLLAVDKRSGKELWKIPQQEPFTGEMACTAVPVVADDRLIVHSARSVQAFDIVSGKRLWIARCATTATSTPIVVGDEVIVAAWNKMGEPSLRPEFPDFDTLISKHDQDDDRLISRDEFPSLWIFHRPEGAEAPQNGATVRFEWADRDKDREISQDEWTTQVRDIEKYRSGYTAHGLLAIPLASSGSLNPSRFRTLQSQSIPEVPSPVSDGQLIYLVKNGGVMTSVDPETGDRVARIRTGGRGTHYASPVIAGGNLYSASGNGHVSVISLGSNPEVLATNDMEDGVYATPAIVDGTIYIRTHSALFAFRTTDRN